MPDKITGDLTERIKIQEKALQELADKLEAREHAFEEEMQDVLEEIKALKVFLSRTSPDFRKQYPEIRRKLKAA